MFHNQQTLWFTQSKLQAIRQIAADFLTPTPTPSHPPFTAVGHLAWSYKWLTRTFDVTEKKKKIITLAQRCTSTFDTVFKW